MLNLEFNELIEKSRIEHPLSLGSLRLEYSGGFGHKESGVLPFLLPAVRAISDSSSCTSSDVAGRILQTGFCIRECAAIADCGRYDCDEGGRVPTLLEYELFELFLMDALDVCRDDMEDDIDES